MEPGLGMATSPLVALLLNWQVRTAESNTLQVENTLGM